MTPETILARLKQLPAEARAMQEFHRRHKFLLLEHSAAGYAKLGRLVGNPERRSLTEIREEYGRVFEETLRTPPSVGTRTNTLEHLLGFLRDQADAPDRDRVRRLIARYQSGEIPYEEPLTLIFELVKRHGIRYLEDQWVFQQD